MNYLSPDTRNELIVRRMNSSDPKRGLEEEYFRLSCLAVKTKLAEADADIMVDLMVDVLYNKCKQENIPFHRYQ